jgi:hypothetical protein
VTPELGLGLLVALVLALIWARRVATKRRRILRAYQRKLSARTTNPRSQSTEGSSRSQMRAGEDTSMLSRQMRRRATKDGTGGGSGGSRSDDGGNDGGSGGTGR